MAAGMAVFLELGMRAARVTSPPLLTSESYVSLAGAVILLCLVSNIHYVV